MLAAARAELLVLRKWPAAWGLLLVMPALALIEYYVLDFVLYLTVTPAQYAQQGTPAQLLPALLPGQFAIVAVQLFILSNVVPFVVLGAVLAGGDWGRGTIATSLAAGPGRGRAGAGQALALAVATAASVAATFAVSAAASLVIRVAEARTVNPLDGAMPPAWVLVRAMGAALLVALTYAAMGWFLGTACRSAAGGIAAALVWTVIIDPNIGFLGTDYTGPIAKISDFMPGTDAVTVTSLFGTVGGGATSQNYLPDRPAIAAWALAGYIAAFLVLTFALLRRRDVLAGQVRHRRRRRAAAPAARPEPTPPGLETAVPPHRASTVLAAVRAELLVMRNRPVLWWLVLAVPVSMLIAGYLTDYINYQSAGNGAPGSSSVSGPLMLPSLLPVQYLTTTLSALGDYSSLYDTAVLFLLGALVAGADWGRGTITTALVAGPGRLATRLGQDLAVLAAAAAGVILMFVLAAGTAAGFAAALAGTAPPADLRFPPPGHLAMAVAGALLVALACTAIGLALGTILRSATKAAAAVLLWAVLVMPNLDQIGPQVHGVLLHLYELLPDAAINTVANLYNPNTVNVAGTVGPPIGAVITPALAFATLALYLLAALAIAAVITCRRTIT
jgi:ABC-2 type transport system permease protein